MAEALPASWLEQIIEAIRIRPVPLVGDDGDVILTFQEWRDLAGLPESTARELRARGEGPRCIKLTDKKLGVTLAEHRRWMKARMERA
ncbi:MAG: hypothetical protein WAK55_34225 [Xanthobacteraceae bacterium]|jgi:hypothetical protein